MSYNKYYTPTSWENYPSENTAINATRLNHLEDGVDELDDRIVSLSTDKSQVSWNQTLIAGQKIAEITINGIQKNVYAPEISDSIVEEAEEQALKAEGYAVGEQYGIPVSSGTYYHNNAKYYSEESADDALISEGYANGTQNGEDVDPDSPYYHNNAKFWSEQKAGTVIKNTTGQFYTTTGGMLDSCVIGFEPKQSGSGTPSPSNIRPITGHTSGEVLRIGKNLLLTTLESLKALNTSGTWNDNVYTYRNVAYTVLTDIDNNVVGINVNGTSSALSTFDINLFGNMILPNGTYRFNGCPSGASASTYYLQVTKTPSPSIIDVGNGNTFIVGNDYVLSRIRIVVESGKTASNALFKPMIINNAETDLSFEPYQGQDITIQFGNTYYGGTFDFVSGVLTDEWVNIASYNGEAITEPWLSSMDAYTSGATPTTGAQVVYKKATATRVQLTPSQINTLVGQNNLSAPLEGQSFASAEYRDNMSAVYITDERVVGKWIDGKDIYQRTIDLGSSGVSVPANSSASTGLAKGNVELPIWSTAISPSGQAFPYIGCSVGSTYIMMENKTGNATTVRYFTFQYTKTS